MNNNSKFRNIICSFLFICRYQHCSCNARSVFLLLLCHTVNMCLPKWEAPFNMSLYWTFLLKSISAFTIAWCFRSSFYFLLNLTKRIFLKVKRHSNHTSSHVKCYIRAPTLSIDANPTVRIIDIDIDIVRFDKKQQK